MVSRIVISLVFSFFILNSFCQDTLPNFSAVELSNGKARISWINPFTNCTQLSVQRSYDSLRFFKTIFTPFSPELPQNGFIDNNYLQQLKIYYRIFYVLDDGSYFFTASTSVSKTGSITEAGAGKKKNENAGNDRVVVAETNLQLITPPNPNALPAKRMFSIYKRSIDSLWNVLDEASYLNFKDSIVTKTKDTLYTYENDIVLLKPYIPKPAWKPSLFIYTHNNGYVVVDIPDFKQHHYRIIFYDDNDQEIFRIKQMKQQKLVLEKGNFVHEGWFYFELFEDDRLREKNKFFVERDF